MQDYLRFIPYVLLVLGFLIMFKPELLYLSENSENSLVSKIYKHRSAIAALTSIFALYLYKNPKLIKNIVNKEVSESISSENSSVVAVPSYRDSVTDTSVSLTE